MTIITRDQMRPGQIVALVHHVVARKGPYRIGRPALHSTGQWVLLRKWKVHQSGSRWAVFGPMWDYLHTLDTFAEAIAWADREARR